MKERPIKNLPASVNRRLLNQAREQGLAFQDLCQRSRGKEVRSDG